MSEWKLDNVEIKYKSYGPDEGKYVGSIRFENGSGDSFRFRLDAERCDAYLALISGEVVRTASELGKRIAGSIGGLRDGQ